MKKDKTYAQIVWKQFIKLISGIGGKGAMRKGGCMEIDTFMNLKE